MTPSAGIDQAAAALACARPAARQGMLEARSDPPPSVDPGAPPTPSFKRLEFDTWQRGAAAYDRLFGAVTRTAIAPMLDALDPVSYTHLTLPTILLV